MVSKHSRLHSGPSILWLVFRIDTGESELFRLVFHGISVGVPYLLLYSSQNAHLGKWNNTLIREKSVGRLH